MAFGSFSRFLWLKLGSPLAGVIPPARSTFLSNPYLRGADRDRVWVRPWPRRRDMTMVKDRTVHLTAEGKARLEEELKTLNEVKLPDLTTRIQEATEHGDVSDNSEYEDLKEEYVLTEARARDLEMTLDHAELIHRDVDDDTIGLGSQVTLRGDDGEEETWMLVSPEEANSLDGTISTDSPVGQALVGRRAGETTTVETPGGTMTYTLLTVV